MQANGQYPNLLGLGDLNFPNIDWTPGMLPSPARERNQPDFLTSLLRDTFSFQMVDQPTRFNNILNLVITNNESIVLNIDQEANTILLDHNTLILNINYILEHSNPRA